MRQIETRRLLLRPLQLADAEPLARIWTDPEVTRYMGGPRDFEKVFASLEQDARTVPAPIYDLMPVSEKSSGHIIGHCGLIDKQVDGRNEIELVYVFAKSCWGKGFATEAASALRDYAFDELSLTRIIALIDPENAASIRVAEKVNLRYESDTARPGGKIMRVYVTKARRDETIREDM